VSGLTVPQRAAIAKLYASDPSLTLEALAHRHGCCRTTIKRAILANGGEIRRSVRRLPDALVADAARRVQQGWTVARVAEVLGVPHSTLCGRLRQQGARSKRGGRNPTILGRRNCAGCGRWLSVLEFSPSQRDPFVPNSRCRRCCRLLWAAHRADPVWVARLREYQRMRTDAHRRAAGAPVRPRKRPVPPDPEWTDGTLPRTLPTGPLLVEMHHWMDAYAVAHPDSVARYGTPDRRPGTEALAHASGVPSRRIWGIVHGAQTRCHYVIADRLAVAIGTTLATLYPEHESGDLSAPERLEVIA
jgi:hypothetical protein